MIINTFQGKTNAKYAAMDTETRTILDGILVTQAELDAFTENASLTEIRERVSVCAWAYIIYTPDGFAIAEDFAEFSALVSALGISVAYWYNMPFDMAVMDYESFNAGMTYTDDPKQAGEFGEKASEFGARYTYTQIFTATDGTSHRITHYDLRNILKGGLAANLASFKVTDFDGAPIRKREMDYQADTIDADAIRYMYNDAAGLWHLVRAFSDTMDAAHGLRIDRGRPSFLTASGLAKKLLLSHCYPAKPAQWRLQAYQRQHPITVELDSFYRERGLLGGGLVMLNPDYKGRRVPFNIDRYDKNSHYPAIIRDMPDLRGYPLFTDGRHTAKGNEIVIYIIDELDAVLRPNAIPAWLCPRTHKVADYIGWPRRAYEYAIFSFELDELENWYIITAHIKESIVYKAPACEGFAAFVDSEYRAKEEATKTGDKARRETAKLILNGAGGKFSENPTRAVVRRTFDGIVHTDIEETKTDPDSLMNVAQGAYITAMGRTILRKDTREATGGKMRENLVYTDTDSAHLRGAFLNVHPTRLGAWKKENDTPITEAIFLAPKTYAEREANGTITVHAKGVNTEAIEAALANGESLDDVYRYGRKFPSLSAVTVKGGRALLKLQKTIAKGE